MSRLFSKTTLVFLLMLLWQAGAANGDEPKSRKWKSSGGKHSVEGKLIDFNKESGTVRLKMTTGDSLDVKFGKLSKSDQKYIKRFQQNVERKQRKEQRLQRLRASRVSNNVVNMYGVDWVPELEQALLLAEGSQNQKNDDRPVMWFRVLGQLDGYM